MIKLSEAIRLGAMLKPQAYGDLVTRRGRTCAFGAAYDALGILETMRGSSLRITAPLHWPWLVMKVPHPILGESRDDILNIVTDLNDSFKWTRERIADWVESIEHAHEPQAPAMPALSLVGVGVGE